MSDFLSDRFALPLLAAGQAGKELTHNEAIAMIDLAVQAAVVGVGTNVPPADPRRGESWIVGDRPVEAWQGRAGCLAGWTRAGWRFVAPREGFAAWNSSAARTIVYSGGLWRDGDILAARIVVDGQVVVGPRTVAIPDPAGGATIDGEARAALGAVLASLRRHGLIAT